MEISGLNDKEKKAIEMLKRIDVKFLLNGSIEQSNFIINEADKINNNIEITLKLIQKQERVIDEMAKQLVSYNEEIDILSEGEKDCFIPNTFSDIDDCVKCISCKDCIKQYFYRKVKEK